MAGETPTPQNLQSLVGWASVPVIGRDSYFHFIYLHLLTNVPPVVTNAPPVVTNAPPVVTNAPPVVTNAPPVVTNAPPVFK
jgi:hypothetical protein